MTTTTQNIFTINEIEKGAEFIKNIDEFKSFISRVDFKGKTICDNGLIIRESNFSIEQQETKEIIEARDCIIDDFLCLPERLDIILKMVEDDYKLQQSCNRFHEAIMLRNNLYSPSTTYLSITPSSIYYIAYELVAYVASIEALLDTKIEKQKINCSSCGETVYTEDRKISSKFRVFIAEYGNSMVLDNVYKELYKDRSKFVHTGINLYSLSAVRQNRPLILEGKNYLSTFPDYYHNIHEYTGFILRKYMYSKLFCFLPQKNSPVS